MVDIRIKTPSNIIVCGSTGSGKSHFIAQCLMNQQFVFTEKFDVIHYVYGVWDDAYKILQRYFAPGIFCLHSSLPKLLVENPEAFFPSGKNYLICFDDFALELGQRRDHFLSRLFTKYNRHCKVTCFFVTHNIFEQFPCARTVALNTHQYVIFRCARANQQIALLGQQLFGNGKFLLSAFKQATDEKPTGGYILVDCTAFLPSDYKVRTGILPDEKPAVYLPLND